MLHLLQIDTQQCLDCAQHAADKDWAGFISCAVTFVIGIVIRSIEKRKLRKNKDQ